MYFIGIDLGTSGVKVLLMDETQDVLGFTQQQIAVSRPHPGWSEQNPADWIQATETALDELQTRFPRQVAAVKGISLSGHMHGATLIDKDDKVLRPCILWNDTRSFHEAAELDADPIFRSISGNIVFPGFTAPKLVWLRNNEKEFFSRVHKVLLPKDYLRLWLSGDYASDMSDSAGTAWLDTGARRWSDRLLSACWLDQSQMPALFEGTAATGRLRKPLAERWKMQAVPVIAGGAGDNAASACGMGIVSAGSAFVSLGTSGVLFAATDRYLPRPESAVHAFCHAVPQTWHQMGVILSATDSLNWYAKICGKSAGELTQALGDKLVAPSGITFLPYLGGERTPHNNARVRAAFSGIGHDSDQASLTRAVLEGVSFAIRDNLQALRQAGTELKRLTAVGGGSRSDYWLAILATVLDMPIDVPTESDYGAALGAARLAMIGANDADPLAVCVKPEIEKTIEPDRRLTDLYAEAYERYREFYPAIRAMGS
ncbi:MAG: xylulokinase [Gammaproteobacteria bacterium]|nr:xylulokinase [Gammaproteobacteria bacterium]